jgi:hypothetical protein
MWKLAMPNFDCIILDTEPLRASGWPNISATLRGLLRLAGRFELPLFISETVELELEKQWLRKLQGTSGAVTESIRKLNAIYEPLAVEIINVQFADVNDVLNSYRQLVAQIRGEWNIQNIPLTQRTLESVLQMSVMRTPPFKEVAKNKEVAGFQDALIYLSTIDFLAQAHLIGAFISRDGIYADRRGELTEYATQAGATIHFYQDIEDVINELVNELVEQASVELRERWNREEQLARQAIEQNTDQLNDFLTSNLKFPEMQFAAGKIIEVYKVRLFEVGNTRIQYAREPNYEQPFNVTFDAKVKVEVLIDTSYFQPFLTALQTREVGAGEPPAETDLPVPKGDVERKDVTFNVEVEATGTMHEDRYDNVVFTSSRLR